MSLKDWFICIPEVFQTGESVGAKLFAKCCTSCYFLSRSAKSCPVCVKKKAWLFLRSWLKGLQRNLAGIFGKHCLCVNPAEYNSKSSLKINVNYTLRHINELSSDTLLEKDSLLKFLWQILLLLCRYPFTADQDIPEMDWEVYLRETANAIVGQQTPQR